MALIADLLVAASDASFGSPEVRFGLFPGGGALLRLPRHLPQSVVTEMALTGEPIRASDARWPTVSSCACCDPAAPSTPHWSWPRPSPRNAPLGVEAAKRCCGWRRDAPRTRCGRRNAQLVDTVFHSDDAQEGARAFAEKRRPPEWTGR